MPSMHAADLDRVERFGGCVAAHGESAAGAEVEQTHVGEPLEREPNGCPRDAEPRDQRQFGHPLAGCELAAHQRLAQAEERPRRLGGDVRRAPGARTPRVAQSLRLVRHFEVPRAPMAIRLRIPLKFDDSQDRPDFWIRSRGDALLHATRRGRASFLSQSVTDSLTFSLQRRLF